MEAKRHDKIHLKILKDIRREIISPLTKKKKKKRKIKSVLTKQSISGPAIYTYHSHPQGLPPYKSKTDNTVLPLIALLFKTTDIIVLVLCVYIIFIFQNSSVFIGTLDNSNFLMEIKSTV